MHLKHLTESVSPQKAISGAQIAGLQTRFEQPGARIFEGHQGLIASDVRLLIPAISSLLQLPIGLIPGT